MARKRKEPEGPLRREGDSEHTREVIDWAEAAQLPIRRPDEFQLKIGPFNYYPTKRTFHSDAAKATRLYGFDLLKELATKWWAAEQLKHLSLWD